jgi:hypothetical protein
MWAWAETPLAKARAAVAAVRYMVAFRKLKKVWFVQGLLLVVDSGVRFRGWTAARKDKNRSGT